MVDEATIWLSCRICIRAMESSRSRATASMGICVPSGKIDPGAGCRIVMKGGWLGTVPLNWTPPSPEEMAMRYVRTIPAAVPGRATITVLRPSNWTPMPIVAVAREIPLNLRGGQKNPAPVSVSTVPIPFQRNRIGVLPEPSTPPMMTDLSGSTIP